MTSRQRWTYVLVSVVLVLSACSTAVGTDPTPTPTPVSGSIDLTVSSMCPEAQSPKCISVDGESIVTPTEFQRAGIESATVAQGQKQSAVDVTFDEDGAAVFHALTKQAADAGSDARLVISNGGKLVSATRVMEAMTGNQVTIMLGPDDSPQEVLKYIKLAG